MNQCLYCSEEMPAGHAVCAACGTTQRDLPAGTILSGRYRVDRVLGRGGFANIYACRDDQLGRPVAIKELFPAGSGRQGASVMAPGTEAAEWDRMVQGFVNEGRMLAGLENLGRPGIVRVYEVFEENRTGYMVMELLHGESLLDRIEHAPGGRLPEDQVLQLAKELCGSLEAIHGRGILHRDLSPQNVIIVPGRGAVLIDFGSARAFSEKTTKMTAVVKFDYAPLEQYAKKGGRFGPPTDISALAATLYHAVVGNPPPEAGDRAQGTALPIPSDLVPGLSPGISSTLVAGLSIRPDGRPQSAAEFLDRIIARAPAQPTLQRQPQLTPQSTLQRQPLRQSTPPLQHQPLVQPGLKAAPGGWNSPTPMQAPIPLLTSAQSGTEVRPRWIKRRHLVLTVIFAYIAFWGFASAAGVIYHAPRGAPAANAALGVLALLIAVYLSGIGRHHR